MKGDEQFTITTTDILGYDELKRTYVRWVLQLTDGNKAAAARLLKMDRRTFYRVLKRCVTSHTPAEPESEH